MHTDKTDMIALYELLIAPASHLTKQKEQLLDLYVLESWTLLVLTNGRTDQETGLSVTMFSNTDPKVIHRLNKWIEFTTFTV